MARKYLMPALAALTVVLFACDRVSSHEDAERSEPARDSAADAAAVAGTERGILAAFQAKDSAKLAGFYAQDAVVAMPGRGQVEGRDAIRGILEGDLKDPAFKLDFTSDKVEASGDLAYSRGRYTIGYTNPQTKKTETGRGSYVTVFKRQADGSWKVVSDLVHAGG